MSAAILQGVPATTIDTDIWVALPERQFVRLTAIILKEKGTMLAPTVAALEDDSLVNFLPRVDGLESFDVQYAKGRRIRWKGCLVRVVSLEDILKSKKFLQRAKDKAHIPLIEETLHLQRIRIRSKKA